MYRINEHNNIKALINSSKNVYTTVDLATLWGITNKNTLWTKIKRYINTGYLIRIHKGVYSKLPIEKVNKFELGCAIMGPYSYVSLETVLVKQGIIMQDVQDITLIGEKSKKFVVNDIRYICKQMNPLLLGNREGINDENNYSVATIERAIADIYYYKPKYFLDNNKIDWTRVNEIKEKVGY